ncbi:MAG: cytochrome c biogenesis protein CcdA [Chloroflexota bacterium]|nr:cytochrome c biogenesis protein CcdA [Chloroflexota bacterium]
MQTNATTEQRNAAMAFAWPAALFVGILGAAFIGALIAGSAYAPAVNEVEALSSSSGSLLERLSTLFPLGFAFSAGMVSSVNPCGFALLPAYLGLYLGDDEAGARGGAERFAQAVLVGAVMTAGFMLVFAVIGLPVAMGARSLASGFPWLGLGVGALLAAAGAYMVSGGKLYAALGMRVSAAIGGSGNRNVRGYFAFGLGYGAASLSCTLPIFLAVVGNTVTASTALGSIGQLLLYGAGMGAVILALTLSIALFRGAMVRTLRRALPHVQTASAVLLLLSGAFIVYYWLTIGGLLQTLGLA